VGVYEAGGWRGTVIGVDVVLGTQRRLKTVLRDTVTHRHSFHPTFKNKIASMTFPTLGKYGLLIDSLAT
jgi:hypothetical protein